MRVNTTQHACVVQCYIYFFPFDKFVATRGSWIDSVLVVADGGATLVLFGIVLRPRRNAGELKSS
ncbi:hypothetical protein Hanom_Chr16g01518961 [Helianthus anomalus]